MSKKTITAIWLCAALIAFSVAAMAGSDACLPVTITDPPPARAAATSTDATVTDATPTDGREVRSFWDTVPGDGPVYAAAPMPVIGDLDGSGDLEPSDARLALRYAVGLTQELEPDLDRRAALWLVDRDGDGAATPADARLILRAAVGLDGHHLPDAGWGVYRLRTYGLPDDFAGFGALKSLAVNGDRVTSLYGKDVPLPLWRIDTPMELQVWLDAFTAVDARPRLPGQEPEEARLTDAEVPAFLKRYSEAFFAENDLLICYKTEGSGGYLQTVFRPSEKDGALTLTVSSAWRPDSGYTADEGCWLVFTPVAKEVTARCRSFDCRPGKPVLFDEQPGVVTEGKLNQWAYAYSLLLAEDTAVTLRKGDNPFVFSLLNAQDGGYLWTYEAEEGISLRERFTEYPDSVPGAPALQVYSFVPDKPGTYTLRFRLKRSWETENIAERVVKVTVVGEGLCA